MSRRMAILLLIVVVLGSLMAAQHFLRTAPAEDAVSAPVHRNTNIPAAQAPAGTAARKAFLPPMPRYNEIWTRPIFSPARKQATVIAGPRAQADPAHANDQPPRFKIVGVAISPAGQAALVRTAKRKIERHYVDEVIDGWTIEAIAPQNVTVSRDGERWLLPVGAKQ